MDSDSRTRFRQAAYAYAAANAIVIPVVAYTMSERAPTTPVLILPGLVVAFLLAWGVHAQWRWLARTLAVLVGVRAALHLLNFVLPDPLWWTVTFLPSSILLADGSQNVAYLPTSVVLGIAAAVLARAGWHRDAQAPAGTTPPS